MYTYKYIYIYVCVYIYIYIISMKKTNSQDLWPRIDSNELINRDHAKRGFKKPCGVRFFFGGVSREIFNT